MERGLTKSLLLKRGLLSKTREDGGGGGCGYLEEAY